MIKILITILIFYASIDLTFGQEIPSDSEILKIVYGNVDDNGKQFTKQIKTDWCENPIYKIEFAGFCEIENQSVLLVRCIAKCSSMHGHRLGYEDIFILKKTNDNYRISNKSIGEEIIPVGDDLSGKIEKIGNDKNALITTFLSTGNNHLERKISISLISDKGLINLGMIDLDYSNEAFYDFENINENSDCKAFSIKSKFVIEQTDKDFFDIKVNKMTTRYSKGCIDKKESSEEVIYVFNGQKYVDREKK